MLRPNWRQTLLPAADRAVRYLEGVPDGLVRARVPAARILAALDRPLPAESTDPLLVIRALADAVEPGITAMQSGRFFGWVIGGGLPASIAADWLTAAWDQNAGSHQGTPAAAAVEQVALRWVMEAVGLDPRCSGALVTGAQTANTVCLAAARNELLESAGWDVEERGLTGAPRLHVVVGKERHDCVPRSLRMLGLGAGTAHVVGADENGRMLASELSSALAQLEGPVIVCAQAGNVNTGGIDPMPEIADLVERRRTRGAPGATWLHVDGAFGLWARASRRLGPLVAGVERADSWATDGHKWPNVTYDCGIAIVARPEPHRRAMAIQAAYLPQSEADGLRNPFDWTPELSRRARGFALYAGLAQLGRRGMEELVDRCCSLALRFRDRLATVDGVEILNTVELNQVLVHYAARSGGDSNAHTCEVVRRVLDEGVCYATGTTWRGRSAMRISVCNWSTDEEDVDRSVDSMTRAHTQR